jgi:hypothetical protein
LQHQVNGTTRPHFDQIRRSAGGGVTLLIGLVLTQAGARTLPSRGTNVSQTQET